MLVVETSFTLFLKKGPHDIPTSVGSFQFDKQSNYILYFLMKNPSRVYSLNNETDIKSSFKYAVFTL